jgi:hypothetical protein
MKKMMPAAPPKAASESRRFPMLAILLLGGVCASLVVWLLPAGAGFPLHLLIVSLVLAPTLAGAWLLSHHRAEPAPAVLPTRPEPSEADVTQALQRARRVCRPVAAGA